MGSGFARKVTPPYSVFSERYQRGRRLSRRGRSSTRFRIRPSSARLHARRRYRPQPLASGESCPEEDCSVWFRAARTTGSRMTSFGSGVVSLMATPRCSPELPGFRRAARCRARRAKQIATAAIGMSASPSHARISRGSALRTVLLAIHPPGRAPAGLCGEPAGGLTLQLRISVVSESMGNHDSGDHGCRVPRSRRRWSSGRRHYGM